MLKQRLQNSAESYPGWSWLIRHVAWGKAQQEQLADFIIFCHRHSRTHIWQREGQIAERDCQLEPKRHGWVCQKCRWPQRGQARTKPKQGAEMFSSSEEVSGGKLKALFVGHVQGEFRFIFIFWIDRESAGKTVELLSVWFWKKNRLYHYIYGWLFHFSMQM